MLTEKDKEYIRENREQIVAGRTETILAWGRTLSGKNPVTGEQRYVDTPKVEYEVVWKIPNAAVDNDTRMLVGGYEVHEDDRLVTFNDITIDIDAIQYVEFRGDKYTLVAKTPIGLGGDNRFECVARLVT